MVHQFQNHSQHNKDTVTEEYERISRLRLTKMSEIWLARRKRDSCKVITKFARVEKTEHPEANQQAIKNESDLLERFEGDPSIIQAFHFAQTSLPGNPYFIAVEYLEGGTVDDLLRQKKQWSLFANSQGAEQDNTANQDNQTSRHSLPIEQALQIIHFTAAALDHIHAAGIVHRDIKPDNIMFRKCPKHGGNIGRNNLVVIDLGIAAIRGSMSSAALSRVWAEPERVKAKGNRAQLKIRSGFDIYSLGKVLRYMLLLENPTRTTDDKLQQDIPVDHLRIQTRLSHTQRNQVASAVNSLLKNCCHPDIARRPSANDIVKQTSEILSLLQRRRNFVRRGVLAAASIALIALLTSGIFFFQQNLSTVQSFLQQFENTSAPMTAIDRNDQGTSGTVTVPEVSPTTMSGELISESTGSTSVAIVLATATTIPTVLSTTTSTKTSTALASKSTKTPIVVIESTEVARSDKSATPTRRPTSKATATTTPTHTPRPTLTPTRRPTHTPRPTSTHTRTATPRPIATSTSTPQQPTVTQIVPTSTFTPVPATPVPPTAAQVAIAINVIGNDGHKCNTSGQETWDRNGKILIVWETQDRKQIPAGYSFDVVVWTEGGDPLTQSQAIHGPNDIDGNGSGRYQLERNGLGKLVDNGQLNRGFNRWSILLIGDGQRKLLTVPSGCRIEPFL